jgi:MFS family permease
MSMDAAETAPAPENVDTSERVRPPGKVHWRDTFRALRHRNYQLFFYGQLVSLVGTWMQQTAMSWLVYQMTGSKFLLGTVAAAGSAPMMFFSMWGGSLADRHPKRSILFATQTAEMLLAFALAAAVWGKVAAPWLIVVISLIGGVAMGFEMPARQAFTIELVGREDLLNAVSLNSSVVNGARVIGPSIAGLLIGSVGPAMCFFLNGVSFIAVLLCLVMMRLPKHVTPAATGSTATHALSGLSYVAKHPRVRTILALFGMVGVFGWSYMVLMPAFAQDVLGLGPTGYGVLMSASGIGALAGALGVAMAGHVFVPRKIALGGVWLFSAALLAFAWNRNFHLALLFLTISGFGMMLFFSTSNTVLQTIVPDEMRGRVMGVWSIVFGAMIPLGSLEAGTLANWIGAPATIGLGALICALAAVVTLLVVRRREAALAKSE